MLCDKRNLWKLSKFFAVNTKLPMLSMLVSKDFTAEKICLPLVALSLMITDSTFLLLEKAFDANIDYIVNFVLITKKEYLENLPFNSKFCEI